MYRTEDMRNNLERDPMVLRHTRTHTYTPTHASIYMCELYICCVFILIFMFIYMSTRCTYRHIHTYTHKHKHTCAHTHTITHTHTRVHTTEVQDGCPEYSPLQIGDAHTRTHTHTHTHTYANTPIHTYTHIPTTSNEVGTLIIALLHTNRRPR